MALLSAQRARQSQQPAPTPTTPSRKVSEDAAHFAQSILDLEERCQRLVAQVSSWENQCNILGIENKTLREALQQTDARLQYFERRTTQLETTLQTAVQIVTDCLKESARPRMNAREQERQTDSGADALPRLLADGPRVAPAAD